LGTEALRAKVAAFAKAAAEQARSERELAKPGPARLR
jgi:hypothetical protein